MIRTPTITKLKLVTGLEMILKKLSFIKKEGLKTL
jgi:hypothetical protein